ncbi:hypothetical protein LTR66_002560, partial [Elasticomyces elasticus]
RPQSPVARSPRLQRRNTKQMHGAGADGGAAMRGLAQQMQQQRTTTNADAAAPTRSSFERAAPARPATSDGATEAVRLARSMRPDMGVRGAGQGLGNSVVVEGRGGVGKGRDGVGRERDGEGKGRAEVYSERTGRKKRFGRLRGWFGLDD